MKIVINYDLLSKVAETNTGFSLNKSSKTILQASSFCTIVKSIFDIPSGNVDILNNMMIYLFVCTLHTGIVDITMASRRKSMAINELKKLSQTLKGIYVNTNYELLLKAYKYKTDYDVHFGNSIPEIEQLKYIMVPAYVNGQEKEISLVQEHVIGTNEYSLSCGEPKKEFKLVKAPV